MRGISRIYWGILLIFLCPVWKTNAASFSGFRQPEMKAVYNKPAKVWESEALPIGNGYMGAMIFGDVYRDVIQVNEHSLWSGGPRILIMMGGIWEHLQKIELICRKSGELYSRK